MVVVSKQPIIDEQFSGSAETYLRLHASLNTTQKIVGSIFEFLGKISLLFGTGILGNRKILLPNSDETYPC